MITDTQLKDTFNIIRKGFEERKIIDLTVIYLSESTYDNYELIDKLEGQIRYSKS